MDADKLAGAERVNSLINSKTVLGIIDMYSTAQHEPNSSPSVFGLCFCVCFRSICGRKSSD